MPADRFFIEGVLKGRVKVSGAEHHHLVHVSRIVVGEEVELVNGKGDLCVARFESTTKQHAELDVLSCAHTPLSPPRFILAVPILRPSKLEWILEKATELGADEFLLFPARYSEKNDLSDHQL